MGGKLRFRARSSPLAGLDEGLHHSGPGACQIAAVVSSAAHSHDPAMAKCVSKGAQALCGMGMRSLAVSHVCDRIAVQAVRTALQEDEFRLADLQVAFDT